MPPPAHWTPAAPAATTTAAATTRPLTGRPLQQRPGEREHHGHAADDHADRGWVGLAHALDHEQVEEHQAGRGERDQPEQLARPEARQAPARDHEQRQGRRRRSAAPARRRAGSPRRDRRRRPASRPAPAPWRPAGIRAASSLIRRQRMLHWFDEKDQFRGRGQDQLARSARRPGAAAARPRCAPSSRSSCATRCARAGWRPASRSRRSRSLARELGVSRGVVVDAYAQLGAEGYLVARQGAPTLRLRRRLPRRSAPRRRRPPTGPPRFDFRPGGPDVSLFPRAAWLASLRRGAARRARRPVRLRRPARRARAAPGARPLPRAAYAAWPATRNGWS